MKVNASPLLIAGLALSGSTLAVPINTGSNLDVPRSPNLNEGDRSPRMGNSWDSRALPPTKWGRRQLPSPPTDGLPAVPSGAPATPAPVNDVFNNAPINPINKVGSTLGGTVKEGASPANPADVVAQIQNYIPIDPSAKPIPVTVPGSARPATGVAAVPVGALKGSAGTPATGLPSVAGAMEGTPAAMIFTLAPGAMTNAPLGSVPSTAENTIAHSPAVGVPGTAGGAVVAAPSTAKDTFAHSPAGTAADDANVPISLFSTSTPSLIDIQTDLDLARLILAAKTGLIAREHPRDFLKRDLLATPLGVLNTATGSVGTLANTATGANGALGAPLAGLGGLVGGLTNTATGLVGGLLPAPIGPGVAGIVTPLTDGITGGLASGDPLQIVTGTVNGALGAVGGVTNLANGLLGGLVPIQTLSQPLTATAAGAGLGGLAGGLGGTVNGLLGTVGGVAHTATGLVGGLLPDPLGSAVNGLGQTLDGTLSGLTGTLTGPAPVSGLLGTTNGLVHGVAGALPLGLGSTVTGLTDGLLGPQGLVGGLTGTLDGVVGGVTGGLLGGLLGGGNAQAVAAAGNGAPAAPAGGLLGGLLGGGGGSGLLGGLLGGTPANGATANVANLANTASAAPQILTSAGSGLANIPGGLVANLGNGRFLTGTGNVIDLSGLLGGVVSTVQNVAGAPLGALNSAAANPAQSVAGIPLGATGNPINTAQGVLANTPLASTANTATGATGNIFNSPAGAAGFASGTLVNTAGNTPTGGLADTVSNVPTGTSGKPPMTPEASALARKIAATAGLDPNTVLVAMGSSNPINAIQSLLATSGLPVTNFIGLPGDQAEVEGTPAGLLIGQKGQIIDGLPSPAAPAPTAPSIPEGVASGVPTDVAAAAGEREIHNNIWPYPIPPATGENLESMPAPIQDAPSVPGSVIPEAPTGTLPINEPMPTLFDIAAPIVGDWASASSGLPASVTGGVGTLPSGIAGSTPSGAVGGIADLA